MIELNEYECGMLDAVLEAFGIPDSLTRQQLLALFDQDEATAFALVQILTREGLIAETGKHGNYELPEKLVLKPKGDQFLKAGGFARRYRLEQVKPVEVNGTLSKLQQHNMKLQNERLTHQTQVFNLHQKITRLKIMLYLMCVLTIAALFIAYYTGHRAGLKQQASQKIDHQRAIQRQR